MKEEHFSYSKLRKFAADKPAMIGLFGVLAIIFIAVYAPLIVNSHPLLLITSYGVQFPFIKYIFNPDASEYLVDVFFNFLIFYIPLFFIARHYFPVKAFNKYIIFSLILLVLIPFCLINWKNGNIANTQTTDYLVKINAPVKYGPAEICGKPYEPSSVNHILGTDHIGRDIFARLVYGARISLAVGLFATLISLIIGITFGLFSGYYGGKIDLFMMRSVEVIICFPTFLLLLILIAYLMDLKFEQSSLIVIPIIGILGWTGLARIVRGEVLKQRELAYIKACEVLGMSKLRIMFNHILPNVSGPIFITAVFAVASNVLAESSLSFLGFGVQPPTASWGELLKQAFTDPLRYWNLTLWPGLMIFLTILFFNLIGEGLRKTIKS